MIDKLRESIKSNLQYEMDRIHQYKIDAEDQNHREYNKDGYTGLNITKSINKLRSCLKSIDKFENIIKKHNGTIISEYNNQIKFKIDDNIIYYGVPSRKIRLHSTNIWRSDIEKYLKEIKNNKLI